MSDRARVSPIDRATAISEADPTPTPTPALHCSHCGAALYDDDAECPACESPIDWGASSDALRSWPQSERFE